MSRKFWISLHLYLAAFFGPVLLMMAGSGGLYLLGYKGQVDRSEVELRGDLSIDPASSDLEGRVREILVQSGIDHDFEYVKVKEDHLLTRPTSRDHYQLSLNATGVTATLNEPDLQKKLIELHLGHGPGWFKNFQKLMAAGIILVVFSGAWLGLTARGLRTPMCMTTVAGIIVSLLLALL